MSNKKCFNASTYIVVEVNDKGSFSWALVIVFRILMDFLSEWGQKAHVLKL